MSVNLRKGQKISLEKNGQSLTSIRLGLSWGQQKKGFRQLLAGAAGRVDLDASAALLGLGNGFVDTVSYQKLTSTDGSVRHTGDDLTGHNPRGIDDNESVLVDLTSVPSNVQTIVLTVNAFSGQAFGSLSFARVRLVDTSSSTEREIGSYNLTSRSHTANISACLVRESSGWKAIMLDVAANGRTIQDLAGDIGTVMRRVA